MLTFLKCYLVPEKSSAGAQTRRSEVPERVPERVPATLLRVFTSSERARACFAVVETHLRFLEQVPLLERKNFHKRRRFFLKQAPFSGPSHVNV